MYRDSRLKLLFPALLMAVLLVMPAGAACPVSWRDKTLTYTRACTMIDAFDNLSQVDPWMVSNTSRVLLAELMNRTSDFNSLLISEALNRSVDKAAIILEMENQQAANDTHTANELYLGTAPNLTAARTGAVNDAFIGVDPNISTSKAGTLATVSDWIQDPANKTAPYSPTGAPGVYNMSPVVAPLYDVNGSFDTPSGGGLMGGMDWGIKPTGTMTLSGLYIRGNDMWGYCQIYGDQPALIGKIWRSAPSTPELLGNVSFCDIPTNAGAAWNRSWVGIRFAHPVIVNPDDIIGFSVSQGVYVSTLASGTYYDNNLPYFGNFETGTPMILYPDGIDVMGSPADPDVSTRIAEGVAASGDAIVENRITVGTGANLSHEVDAGAANLSHSVDGGASNLSHAVDGAASNLSHEVDAGAVNLSHSVDGAGANITASMPLAGNTSVPGSSITDDIVTFLDATGHGFKDGGSTLEQLINQALIRDTNATAGITLGAVGQQQNPLIEANRTGSENTAAHMVASNLSMGGNVSVPGASTQNDLVIFADALGHTFSDSGILISSILTTFAPAIKEMEDQMDFNLTHWYNEGILSHVFNDTHWFNEGIIAHIVNDTSWFNQGILAHVANDTSWFNQGILAHVFNDTHWFNEGVLAHVLNDTHWFNIGTIAHHENETKLLKEAGDQYLANDTLTKGASVKICTDRLEENQSSIKGAAVKTCDDHIGTNITTTADIRLMAYQFVVPASGGAAYSAPVEGASGNIWIPIDFDGTTSEIAVADVPLPGDYSTGFTETYSWTATSAGGGGVVWGTELICIADNVALDSSWGSQVLVTDTFQTSGALHISPVSATTTPAGTCLSGRTLAIRVKRMPTEAGDTMSDDARFLGMNLTYTKAGA